MPNARPPARDLRRHSSAPPAAYFATSAVFHYLGPAFAVLLFARARAARRRRPAHRDRRRSILGRVAPAVATGARVAAGDAPRRARLGPGAGDDERVLLRGDRPPARSARWPPSSSCRSCCSPRSAPAPRATGWRCWPPSAGVALLTNVHARGRARRPRVRRRQRGAVPALHRARPPRGGRRARAPASTGSRVAMLVAAIACTPLAAHAAAPALSGAGAAARGDRRGHLVVRRAVRGRPARPRPAAARHLRAHGLAAAGDRRADRPRRAAAGAAAGGGPAVSLVVAGVALHQPARAEAVR